MSPGRGIEEPLVFESLTTSGYTMWKDEFTGLDMKHASIAMQTFGKMHAAG
jgi:hypothetical protein